MNAVEQQLSTAFAGISSNRWKPGQLLDFVRDHVIDVLELFDPSELTDEQKAQIFETVANVYDQYIAPLDIPYVPALVEGYLDDFIWRVICGVLCEYLDYDCEEHEHAA